MRIKFFTEHIVLLENEVVQVSLIIDNYELFDVIGDYLAEKNDIEYDYFNDLDGKFEMIFAKQYSFESIVSALSKFDEGEIQRIWELNNIS